MKKFNVVAASAVALTAALAGGNAFAHGTVAVTTATYDAALVASATPAGTVTVPWNGLASAVYTVNSNGAGNSLDVNSRFTVTLPTGFTFASPPQIIVGGTLNPNGNTVTPTGAAGQGVGFGTATFFVNQDVLNGGGIPAGGTLAMAQVSVANATALETVTTAPLNITMQSDENSQIDNNDPSPVPPPTPGPVTFAATTGVTATFMGGGASIDLTSPSLGKEFVASGLLTPGTDSTVADIGTLTLVSDNSLGADGVPHILATSDTATLTIPGFFNGIASVTATDGLDVVPATPSALSVTLPNAGLVDLIDLISSDTALLQQNPSSANFLVTGRNQPGFTVQFAPGTGTTDFLGGSAANATDSIVYTGGQVLPVTNFFTGTDAGYQSVLRVNNAGVVAADLFALVQPYSGGPQLVGSLGPIDAGTGTVFFESQVQTDVPGLDLANSGQRATLTVIAVGTGVGQVAASDLLVNPGGVVVNVN
jgi:hypothetical protein